MPDTLIIYEKNNAIVCAGFENRKPVSLDIEEKKDVFRNGNVYVGHINKILWHLRAAYVDIGMPDDCYMELKEGFDYLTDKDHPDGELHVGDDIIVQLIKQPLRKKPATVCPAIEIDGRLAVIKYMGQKQNTEVCFSSKISDKKFKNEMSSILSPAVPTKMIALLRTNATEASHEEIVADYERGHRILENIIELNGKRTKGSLLYSASPKYITTIRDSAEIEVKKMITDSPDVYVTLKDYLSEYRPEMLSALEFYSDEHQALENVFDMQKNLSEICSEKVWLKSGAQLVIQQTEALISIDINSSKASADRKNFKNGFLELNLEAAREISRQLILRNYSGVIIVDFINDKSTPGPVFIRELEKIFEKDKRTQVVDITKLGLVELTRKREEGDVSSLIKKYKLISK